MKRAAGLYESFFLNRAYRAACLFRLASRVELDCFIRLQKDVRGRYVKFKVKPWWKNLTREISLESLTVYDITEQTICGTEFEEALYFRILI